MAIITKYSKSQDMAASTITVNDNDTPFTFQNWIDRNTGIIPGNEKRQYEDYVKNWYASKNTEIPTSDSVKEDYINLLKQLTLSFKSDADSLWLSNIDFNDPLEVEQAIPFYATKLKEIAIYFINKREAIRRAKLKYNMTGAYTSIERIFYEYLLKAFTKRQFPGNEYITNITDISVLNAIPELSAVRSNFQIFVEELYDDASYFDRDPTLPASAYFTFNSDATAYLDNLNISPSDYEWLYSTGVSQLCADNPLLWSVDNVLNQYKSGIPLSAVELSNSDILNDYNRISLTKKYLGESQYILSGGYFIPRVSLVDFNFQVGNNWFYWVTGENIFENDTATIYDPIYLSATNLIPDMATAGLSITSSDIIYVTRNDSISGSWLKLTNKTTFNPVMSAKLNKGSNVFAFPFPGYGLSGEDLVWSGKALDNLNQTFYYLDKPTQKAVYEAYWNSGVSSISSFAPVYINDTPLADSGAKSAEKFDDADYIIVRNSFKDNAEDYIYNGNQEYAWLYKMAKTDVPVKIGNNNIYWPFERYDTNISMLASSNQCFPISLVSVSGNSIMGSVAGIIPETSDKLFKKISPNSPDYIEGAWLSGALLPQPYGITVAGIVSACYQPNLAMKVLGGSYSSFIWTDATTSPNNVFKNIKHQNDCWYLKDTQFSLFKERPTQERSFNYNQWQDCTCRSIVYSPLGHPGNTFDEYEKMADFIIAVTTPISAFDFNTWKGLDGLGYKTSKEFGWFKLNGEYTVEPDVGWGSGSWVTYSGNSFMLSSNVMYLYYRSDMHRDEPNSNVPYLIEKYKTDNAKTRWSKLYYDKLTLQWKDAGVQSDMVIYPGDMLVYDHKDTFSYILTTSKTVENETPTVIPYFGVPTSFLDISGSLNNFTLQANVTAASTISINSCSGKRVTDYYTYTNESINFMLNVPLIGARPIWVTGSDKDDDYTKQKGINIWSGSPVLVDEYNFITQPPFSNIEFSYNTYVEYIKRDVGSIVWKQPLQTTVAIEEKTWCKVLVDTNGVSNLSAVLYNNINDLIISATDIESDMIFDVVERKPLLVNYFARNAFTWTQELSNSSLGVPPTGGVWIPVESGQLISPDAPYAHLSNRHYPTYATVPSIADLYTTKDNGGYMIPRLLGASLAVSKNLVNVIDTSSLDNNPQKRGITAIYRDMELYNSDRGLSNTDQYEPVRPISVDSSWMKASVTEGKKAGIITQARQHQEFMPYQTKYESIGSNDSGVYRQGSDSYDPWFGDLDDTWANDVDWPANFRQQYDIQGWYNQNNNDYLTYQWKTDIFGNHYALTKPSFSNISMYNQKHNTYGSLWTRNYRNIVEPATVSLKDVFAVVPSGIDINSMVYDVPAILDIDIWCDTLMLYTSSILMFFKLDYDYDTGTTSSNSDETNYITTENSKFGGTWYFENEKKVTICTLLSCGDQIRPVLRSLDINTSQMSYLYNVSSTDTDMSAFLLSSYNHPVFTYDNMTKTYNISYVGYGSQKAGMYLTTINIRDYGEYYNIATAKTLVPEA